MMKAQLWRLRSDGISGATEHGDCRQLT